MGLVNIPNENKYIAIESTNVESNYPISILCEILEVSRSGYYKWSKRIKSKRQLENERLAAFIIDAYNAKDGVLGYRQMELKVHSEFDIKANHKRIYRIMRILDLKSVCRVKRKKYIKSTPAITAENLLDRNFKAEKVNTKWLTDVTEFKYGNGKKAYLSAILDICDNSIISFVFGNSNNNELVFSTLDLAKEKYVDAKPLFHSDRGFQYTNKIFKAKLDKYEMTQSMSRVGRCIDNSPMERFWGTLKSEMYNLRKFNSYDELRIAVEEYINYYNNQRYQRKLNRLTPSGYRKYLTESAA